MPLRARYNVNGRFQQSLKHYALAPTFFYETAPGETWSGKISTKGLTVAQQSLCMNRMFWDHYVFYVPFRLVWEDWPNFVTQRPTSSDEDDPDTIPTEVPSITTGGIGTSGLDWLFVKQPAWDAGGATYKLNSLPLRCYNEIWNKFFRMEGEASRAIEATSQAQCTKKPNDYHSRLLIGGRTTAAAIPTGDLDDLRSAIARDHFAQMRDRTGDRYSDYLHQHGVNPGAILVEDPEVVARGSTELKLVITANTNADAVGESVGFTSGYYTLNQEITLRRFYAAEHGVLMGVAVPRVEAQVSTASHPSFAKRYWHQYWTPELAAEKASNDDAYMSVTYQANSGSTMAPDLAEMPERFLDYKVGIIVDSRSAHYTTGGTRDELLFSRRGIGNGATDPDLDLLQPDDTDFDNLFDDAQGALGSYLTTTKLEKQSPVRKVPIDPLR